MSTTIYLRYEHGIALLRAAHLTEFPETVGDHKFGQSVRSKIMQKLRQLFKAMRDVSPIYKRSFAYYFGDESNYEDVTPKKEGVDDRIQDKQYSIKDRNRTQEVILNGAAKDALYWLLFLWTNPDSKNMLSAGLQEEFVWPLAEQIKMVRQLEEDIGLYKKETIELKDDEARAAEDTAKEAEKK